MDTYFPHINAAVYSPITAPVQQVLITPPGSIAATPLACLEVHTDHGLGRIGTATLVLPAPAPAAVQAGARIRIFLGYLGVTAQVFDGLVPTNTWAIDVLGSRVTLRCLAWSSMLVQRERTQVSFGANAKLDAMFRSLCGRRKLPAYLAQTALWPDGSPVTLGGVREVDDSLVVLPTGTGLLDWLRETAELAGYQVTDWPTGQVALVRALGAPPRTGVYPNYTVGLNALRMERTSTTEGLVNSWEVLGARYTRKTDGVDVAIRSIPATITPHPLLPGDGIAAASMTDARLVTQTMADHARNVQEIRTGAVRQQNTWRIVGDPTRVPGERLGTIGPAAAGGGATQHQALWVASVNHDLGEDGVYTTDLAGFAEFGTPVAAGDDCVTTPLLGPEGRHVGNETLAHYRRPTPDGTVVVLSFTPLDNYSSLTVTGWAHGCNSFLGSGGGNAASEASTFETWQRPSTSAPFERVGNGVLPVLGENLAQKPNYLLDDPWSPFTLPVSGALRARLAVEVRMLAGYDAEVGDRDDFEVRDLALVTCGVGEPLVVSEGTA